MEARGGLKEYRSRSSTQSGSLHSGGAQDKRGEMAEVMSPGGDKGRY